MAGEGGHSYEAEADKLARELQAKREAAEAKEQHAQMAPEYGDSDERPGFVAGELSSKSDEETGPAVFDESSAENKALIDAETDRDAARLQAKLVAEHAMEQAAKEAAAAGTGVQKQG
ncbi:MAG: hypothetical protein WC813_04360 [Patescibacteria group bacterium]|jgi:hypothetical protein